MNSRNQKGVSAKAEGLSISSWGTQKHGVIVGSHTEGTACWEADQEGGHGWSTRQQDRAGGGRGGSARRHCDRHGGFRFQVSRMQAPAFSPHDARGPITQGNTPRWTQLGRHWVLTRGAAWAGWALKWSGQSPSYASMIPPAGPHGPTVPLGKRPASPPG